MTKDEIQAVLERVRSWPQERQEDAARVLLAMEEAPGVYVLDEETGVATIMSPDDATIEQLFAGARACPTQAIIIEQFGRRVYPTILTPMFGEGKEEAGSDEE